MLRYFNQRVQILDTNGDPVPGAKLEFFEAGTSNQLDTYSDYALTSANTNPVVCDSGGYANIFLKKNTFYDYTTVDSNDVTVYPKQLKIRSYEPPLTTKGDIFTFDTDFQRLAVGADGLVLKADSSEATGLVWGSAGDAPLTTKGDLFTYDTDNQRLPVGNDGSILLADSTEATGLKWVNTNLRATTSGTVSLTGATWVTITFDTETEDTDAIHNTTTYTTTIAVDGWYHVAVSGTILSPDINGTSIRYVYTPNGGSAEHIGHEIVSESGDETPFSSMTRYLQSGDTILIQMRHGNTTKTLAAGATYEIRRIA